MPSIDDGSPVDVDNELMFISMMLIGYIGHKCECEGCSARRSISMASLMWLLSKNTPVGVEYAHDGEGMRVGVDVEAHDIEVPSEVVAAARARLRASDLSAQESAVINGFLEKLGIHG